MEFTKDISFSNVLRENKKIGITYSGELYKKQSESLTIVYGFGENWEHTTEQGMTKTENGFTVEVEIKPNFDTFNFCFRNGNYEWDNNQSFNYISSIQPAIVEAFDTAQGNVVDDDVIDSDFIIELLDSLLSENIATEVTSEQGILNEVLVENTVQEEFDLDKLIENILEPVVNVETISEVTETTNTVLAEETGTVEGSTEEATGTALIPTSEDTFLVSPRKLRKFYLIGKKIKLAFYKLFVSIPKMLSGNFEENKN